MANPNVSQRELRESAESVRDASERFAGRAKAQAEEMAHNVYEKASDWWQENSGRTLGILGAAAAIGLAGFYLGRRSIENGAKKDD